MPWQLPALQARTVQSPRHLGLCGCYLCHRNLNHNFIGGTLPADLPTIFPNLEHLSLDHCRDVSSSIGSARNFNWQSFPATGAAWDLCPDSAVTAGGGASYVLSGTIPASWGAWNATLKTL